MSKRLRKGSISIVLIAVLLAGIAVPVAMSAPATPPDALVGIIAEAEALDYASFTRKSWGMLVAALDEARNVQERWNNSSQLAGINRSAAAEKLRGAMASLERISDFNVGIAPMGIGAAPMMAAFALPEATAGIASSVVSPEEVEAAMRAALDGLSGMVDKPQFGSVAGEWTVLTLARAGHPVPQNYFRDYLAHIGSRMLNVGVTDDPNSAADGTGGQFPLNRVLNPSSQRWEMRLGNAAQSTENVRLAIALTALGIDASNFTHNGNSFDLISRLNNRAGANSPFMLGEGQGINGPIWSQIALNSRGWNNPYAPTPRAWVGGTTEQNPVTDEERVQWILDTQLRNSAGYGDGGWNLLRASPAMGSYRNIVNPDWTMTSVPLAADPDMTAMALSSLAPWYRLEAHEWPFANIDRSEFRSAIGRGLNVLSVTQAENGGWEAWGNWNVQSSAQVVVALVALGYCPQTDPRFVMPHGNPVSDVLMFQNPETGMFTHPHWANGGSDNLMATDQGAYALVAYWRFRNGYRHLYDMADAAEFRARSDAGSAAWGQQLSTAALRTAVERAEALGVNNARLNHMLALAANAMNSPRVVVARDGPPGGPFTYTQNSVHSSQVTVDAVTAGLNRIIYLIDNNDNGTPTPSPSPVITLTPPGNHAFSAAVVGYAAAPAAHSVTVRNTGTQATGTLTVALSGSDANSFTLSRTSVPSIAANATQTFTVRPVTGLAAGTYNATVTVSGTGFAQQSFTVSFAVSAAPAPAITLTPPGNHTFAAALVGYTAAPAAHSVTVRNTGTQATGALTVALSGANANSFTLSRTSVPSIAANATQTFTVRPVTGLAAGTYNATVTVSGTGFAQQSFTVSFTVSAAATGDRTALNAAISQAQNANLGHLQNRLTRAQAVANNPNATQQEINNAASNLRVAFAARNKPAGRHAFISVTDPNINICSFWERAGITPSNGIFHGGSWVSIGANDTAYSVLRRLGLNIRSTGEHAAWAGVYVQAVNNWGEFDGGALSGWMYRVNDIFPGFSSSLFELEDGDIVEWIYTRQLGNDIEGDMSGLGGDGMLNLSRTVININDDNLTSRVTAGGQSATRTANFNVNTGQLPDAVTVTRNETTFTITGVRPASGQRIQGAFPVTISVGGARVTFTVNVNLTPLTTGTADRTALNNAIADAEMRVQRNYTTASWTRLQTALTAARGLAANATQAQINTALNNLRTALGGLVRLGNVNITLLSAAITDAIARVSANYTTASWAAMQAALTAARAIRDNLESTQAQVDSAAASLQAALDGLETITGGSPSATGVGVATDGWTSPFNDITPGAWYFDYVRFVYTSGLMTGTGPGQFSPSTNLSRAMVVTILARQHGTDESGGTTWYSGAVDWGVYNGLTDGTNLSMAITREQFATILYRYAALLDHDTGNSGNLAAFADMFDISVWARDAMRWANANGLITGRTETTLAPQGTATRAEAAAILQRFIENVVR